MRTEVVGFAWGYTSYHFGTPAVAGVSVPFSDAVVIERLRSKAVAHELGHTYGLRTRFAPPFGGEEYLSNPPGVLTVAFGLMGRR